MENLTKKLVRIQGSLKAPKNQRNNFGNYNYRSCEDILEAVKPLLAKEELLLTITDSIAPEPLFVNAVAEITDGVDKIQVRAQAGINLNRKGMDVAQCYGASSSYARKYALNGLFLIDDTKDADATNNHSKASQNASTSVLEPNKDWLQEPKDYIGKGKHTEENNPFISCKQAIKEKGFTITDIRKKYKVSKKVEKLLLT
tara:strand:- start:2030 stop:2629 length:600 start_codon:yes stop_codon:yes gene_type:complete